LLPIAHFFANFDFVADWKSKPRADATEIVVTGVQDDLRGLYATLEFDLNPLLGCRLIIQGAVETKLRIFVKASRFCQLSDPPV
jgi:hypothetical protein